MAKHNFALYNAVEVVLRETADPLRALQLFEHSKIRPLARDTGQIVVVLNSFRNRNLVARTPAPALPNDKSRYVYQWRRERATGPVPLTARLYYVYEALRKAKHPATTGYLLRDEGIIAQGQSINDISAALRDLMKMGLAERTKARTTTPFKGSSKFAYFMRDKTREPVLRSDKYTRNGFTAREQSILDAFAQLRGPATAALLFESVPTLTEHFKDAVEVSDLLMRLYQRHHLERSPATAEQQGHHSHAIWAYGLPQPHVATVAEPQPETTATQDITVSLPVAALAGQGVPNEVAPVKAPAVAPEAAVSVTQENGELKIHITLTIVLKTG